MNLWRLTFKANADLVVNAATREEAPAVAEQCQELNGEVPSEVTSITPVTNLGQLFDPN